MREKQLMSNKIECIASNLGVSKKDIKLIINSFLIYKQRELLNGREIKISDIVEIVPEPILDNTLTTLAFISKEIANVHGFTLNTVKTILEYYIEVQHNQILCGKSIDFRGLVKIHPKIENGIVRAIHSSISTVVTNTINSERRLTSVRVHTAKALKQQVYGKQIIVSDVDIEDDIDFDSEQLEALNVG